MGKMPAMLIALVANPNSGGAPGADELARRLGAGGAEVHATAIDELTGTAGVCDGPALREGTAALTAGGRPDRVVVAGGDGSIGLAARLAAELDVPLGVIPAGTANDFARAKDIPLDLEQAAQLAAAPDARPRAAELALVGDRPFVNAAAAGMSVIAAREAHDHKSRLGPLAYTVGALLAGVKASPLHATVTCDGEVRHAGDVWQVVVGVTGAFGGGSAIGGTDPVDGQLDVAVVPAGSRVGLVRRAYGMRAGRLTAQDDVPHLRGREIVLDLRDDAPRFNVDGELCDCVPARFALHPGGFRVLVP
jgi:diacylglycerol kinase family enzyme